MNESDSTHPLHIVGLSVQNVLGVKAVDIRPEGQAVVLTGDNEQGKSSLINSIYIALTGKMPERVIRDGSSKARISLDIGEFIVERTITQKNASLKVMSADQKSTFSSPQKMLDGLLASLTLDPLDFAGLKPKEQREMLLQAAGINLSAWEAEYMAAYEARKLANRDEATAKSAYDNTPKPEGDDIPAEEVSLSDVIDERDHLMDMREAAEAHAEAINEKRNNLRTLAEQIEELEVALERKKTHLEAYKKQLENLESTKIQNPTDEDLEAARAKVNQVESINRAVRARQASRAASQAWTKAKTTAEEADSAVKAVQQKKIDLLAAADFGVPGLSVDDEGVVYEGIPYSQLSTARQIEVAMLIAMRLNPKLRIIIIREGALIGSKIKQSIFKLAQDNGYQVWMEQFQEQAGPVGLHIEAGEVVAIDGKAVS
ncbi:AAA family ATPase [Ruficoccus amylovorans]|uniref:AAA family ATPase n=1 Tax=Ruficoccus amylovorans TaxID=1804625 RepID=A0A842HEB1_9BACT|nr:AAA family ATPase [Ruficoccus amylovorans]MBC2594915.1 AAA family ATPase [Ruficoccus amylovorans]